MIAIGGEPWGTAEEIAEAMRISRRTVQRYVAAGLVRRSGRHRCLADVVAAEKSRRDRMNAGRKGKS